MLDEISYDLAQSLLSLSRNASYGWRDRRNATKGQGNQILTTMCEIQDILYSREIKRTNQVILRLHNTTFRHSILLNQMLKGKCKKITKRKMYGKYYHALFKHASEQIRIVCGRSSNTEPEERTFNFLKSTSTLTSNHHAENVVVNSIIRSQAKDMLTNNASCKDLNKEIDTLYSTLKKKRRETVFENKNSYQAHLERIADFLIEERMYWEEGSEGVVFKDIFCIQESKKELHNFRNWTLQKELQYLKNCWEEVCMSSPHKLIPTCSVKIDADDGSVITKQLSTLACFQCDAVTEEPFVNTNDETATYSLHDKNYVDDNQDKNDQNTNIMEDIPKSITDSKENTDSREAENNKDSAKIISLVPVTVFIPEHMSTPVTKKPNTAGSTQNHQLATKTGKILQEILGLTDDVYKYDSIRDSYKRKPSKQKKEKLQNIQAVIEVKIINENEKLKLELNNMESSILMNNKSLTVLPRNCEQEETYNLIL